MMKQKYYEFYPLSFKDYLLRLMPLSFASVDLDN